SLLNSDDDAYIAARAIQFFTPGIPQIYYVGLLAGENDMENVKKTGEGREINRHNFSIEEVDMALQKPVVQRLLELIRFRNEYGAFNGEFKISNTSDKVVRLSWQKDNKLCLLSVDLETNKTLISYTNDKGELAHYNV
ncbi:MAG: hypothetical protein P1P88_25185, partial [Bacteroidales bacterium]|nr:hypothetical protein [Bacteroidales bacterium]